MNKSILLFFMMCALCRPVSAQGAQNAPIEVIRANMGGVDFSGLPRLSFYLAGNAELARLGFVFYLTHRGSADCEGARSEWLVTGVYTCACKDTQGNAVWIKPDGRNIVFKSPLNNAPAQDGSRVKSMDEDGNAVLEDGAGNLWTYQRGFIVSIENPRLGKFIFQTDSEAILSISKFNNRGANEVLLNIAYSEAGEIQSLACPNGETCSLSRDARHRLVAITEAPRPNILLEYDNLLLAKWRSTDGTGNAYAWEAPPNIAERIDLGSPPVLLRRYDSFIYEYGQSGGARIIRVKTSDNRFVSETRTSLQGIRQRTSTGQILEFRLGAPGASPK